jgi:hypothetical protein
VGVHAAPGWHATQAPAAQTSPRPQPVEVPSGAGPVTLQTGVPVEQAVTPSWQAADGVQPWPSTQTTQAPEPSHTCPAPQLAPAASGVVGTVA